MTPERAAFIEELQARAQTSVDATLLSRAATLLIGDEQMIFDAYVREAAAQREADRLDLTDAHRTKAVAVLALATKDRAQLETTNEDKTDGRTDADARTFHTRPFARG